MAEIWHSTKSSRLAATTLLAVICLSCQEGTTSWETHWQKGNFYFQHRDFVKAEAELKAALRLAEASEAPDLKMTQSMVGLGMLYDAQRRFEEAQRQFERAVHLIESTRGANHSDLVMPLNYLGALHAIQHHFETALPSFERAFSIQERSLGPTHSLMHEHIKYLAAFHVSRAQYHEAEAFLTRVLELPTPPGEIGKETAEYLDNYTRLHTAQEEYNKAKPYLDEFDRVDGGQLPQTLHQQSASLARLTNILGTKDKLEKAEALLLRAVRETEKTHGSTDLGLAHRLYELADLYWAWGKLDAAIPLLERSLSMTGHSATKDDSKPHPSLRTTPPFQTDKQLAKAAASYRQALGTGISNGNGGQQMLMEAQHKYLALLRTANRESLYHLP